MILQSIKDKSGELASIAEIWDKIEWFSCGTCILVKAGNSFSLYEDNLDLPRAVTDQVNLEAVSWKYYWF